MKAYKHKIKKPDLKKFSDFVVKYRYVFFGVWAAFLIASIILIPRVQANYDISSYLPDDMETRRALNIMQTEFGMNTFANVMVEDVSVSEANSLCKRLNIIEGVKLTSFDSESGFVLKIANEDEANENAKGSALIKLTLSGGDFSESAQTAIKKVERTLSDAGKTYHISGSAIDGARLQNGIGGEMMLIMIISAVVVLAILLLSSRSWFEPIIFLLVVGVAILINLGTNVFFCRISYITKSIAAILQLALAMDYSIVLLHNFDGFIENGDNAITAASKALSASVMPIVSSSLTTVAGLVALMFMSFGIGLDIGLVMSKGIIISMLTVFFLMPGLLVLMNKPLAKLRHKPLPLGGGKLATGAVKARFVLPFVFAGLIIAGAVLQSFNTYSFTEEQPNADRTAIETTFEKASASTMIIIVPRAKNDIDYAKQDRFIASLSSVTVGEGENKRVPYVEGSAQTYISTLNAYMENLADESMLVRLMAQKTVSAVFNGPEHSRFMVSVELKSTESGAYDYIDAVKAKLDSIYGKDNTYMAGGVMTNYDIAKAFNSDLIVTNLITIISILLIIGISFRSFSVPVVLVVIIQGAIWAAMSISFLLSQPIFFMSYLIASAILMGATIDYAILITDTYAKARSSNDRLSSVKAALIKGMPTVLTSGLILTIAGFIVGGISTSLAISTIGTLLGRGALAAIILVLIFLPELLYLFDKLIQKTSFGMKFLPEPKPQKTKTQKP